MQFVTSWRYLVAFACCVASCKSGSGPVGASQDVGARALETTAETVEDDAGPDATCSLRLWNDGDGLFLPPCAPLAPESQCASRDLLEEVDADLPNAPLYEVACGEEPCPVPVASRQVHTEGRAARVLRSDAGLVYVVAFDGKISAWADNTAAIQFAIQLRGGPRALIDVPGEDPDIVVATREAGAHNGDDLLSPLIGIRRDGSVAWVTQVVSAGSGAVLGSDERVLIPVRGQGDDPFIGLAEFDYSSGEPTRCIPAREFNEDILMAQPSPISRSDAEVAAVIASSRIAISLDAMSGSIEVFELGDGANWSGPAYRYNGPVPIPRSDRWLALYNGALVEFGGDEPTRRFEVSPSEGNFHYGPG